MKNLHITSPTFLFDLPPFLWTQTSEHISTSLVLVPSSAYSIGDFKYHLCASYRYPGPSLACGSKCLINISAQTSKLFLQFPMSKMEVLFFSHKLSFICILLSKLHFHPVIEAVVETCLTD